MWPAMGPPWCKGRDPVASVFREAPDLAGRAQILKFLQCEGLGEATAVKEKRQVLTNTRERIQLQAVVTDARTPSDKTVVPQGRGQASRSTAETRRTQRAFKARAASLPLPMPPILTRKSHSTPA